MTHIQGRNYPTYFLGGDLDFDLDRLCRRRSRLGEGLLAGLSSSDDTTRLVAAGEGDRD